MPFALTPPREGEFAPFYGGGIGTYANNAASCLLDFGASAGGFAAIEGVQAMDESQTAPAAATKDETEVE